MKFLPQTIPDVLLIEPVIHRDERGYFVETFKQKLLDEALGYQVKFIQDNESKSTSKGVLRGLHYQLPPYTQNKLVRVIKGEVLDVAVDIRRNSPTFGKHVSVVLSEKNKKQIFVPGGFAHGFIVLSDGAIFAYKVDAYYSSEHEEGIAYNDKEIDIDWHFLEKEIILSKADQNYSNLSDNKKLF
ncbi:MAG: dTDP-4-dehydrorhamnose 3,5-epimerase [Pelagibacterales bacterium]|nr:dTDP-4-dehydrorhamnose 3,5-epimerase [Pelagibacterales bacterium]